jgi:toxin ParE1/3/4
MPLVRWSRRAVADLLRIIEHLRVDNPAAAQRLADRLWDAASSLHQFEHRGRLVNNARWPGARELVVPPYVLVYRVRDGLVEIAHVYHSAQEP